MEVADVVVAFEAVEGAVGGGELLRAGGKFIGVVVAPHGVVGAVGAGGGLFQFEVDAIGGRRQDFGFGAIAVDGIVLFAELGVAEQAGGAIAVFVQGAIAALQKAQEKKDENEREWTKRKRQI